MRLEPEQVRKPVRKLRKELDAFSSNPRPEDVHSLRTQTRRLEATVAALVLDRKKEPRRLLKLITPVRKAAGKVRDMDVLIGEVLTLADSDGGERLVRLIEHLALMRVKHARKLHDVVGQQRKEARKRLKESSRLLKKAAKNHSGAGNGEAAPQILITELGHWPGLDAGNLHPFRIRIKELRYMLQLSEEADGKMMERLGAVKDAIGEWHDWVELLRIAKKVLDAEDDDGLLRRIEKTGKDKFQIALAAASELRERYFKGAAKAKTSKKILPIAAGF